MGLFQLLRGGGGAVRRFRRFGWPLLEDGGGIVCIGREGGGRTRLRETDLYSRRTEEAVQLVLILDAAVPLAVGCFGKRILWRLFRACCRWCRAFTGSRECCAPGAFFHHCSIELSIS